MMPIVDLKRGREWGRWEKVGSELMCRGSGGVLSIPHIPPDGLGLEMDLSFEQTASAQRMSATTRSDDERAAAMAALIHLGPAYPAESEELGPNHSGLRLIATLRYLLPREWNK